MRSVAELRGNRYEMLRNVIARSDGSPTTPGSPKRFVRWCCRRAPGASASAIDEVRAAGAEVAFTGIRRQGILGREPTGDTEFQDGDIVVIYGTPEQLEHAEAVLLAG